MYEFGFLNKMSQSCMFNEVLISETHLHIQVELFVVFLYESLQTLQIKLVCTWGANTPWHFPASFLGVYSSILK